MRWTLPTVAGLAVIVAACGSGADDADNPASPPESSDQVSTTTATTVATTDPTEAPADPTTTDEPTGSGASDGSLEPVGEGPYAVGRITASATDDTRARTLTYDVWYPAEDVAAATPAVYSFLPGIELLSLTALDGPPSSGDGPFPLVVYSHGSGGLRYLASFLTETLASHGYVVVSPDHAGNTAADQLLGSSATPEENAIDRPLDVSFLIDTVGGPDAPPEIAGIADVTRVAVVGHSVGGYTAFATAGGVEVDGTRIEPDDRVDAVVALAPASSRLPDETFAAIEEPTLLLAGTADTVTPIDPNVTRPFELLGSSTVVRADLVDAAHQSVTDVCRYQDELPSIPGIPDLLLDFVDGYAEQACLPEQMPIERAHELTNTFTISFLDAFVADDDPEATVELTLGDLPGDVVVAVRTS